MTRKEKWNKLAPEAKTSGISEWKSIEQVKASNLKWSKNGNQRHGKFFGLKEYLWETKRSNRAVTALRTIGFDPDVKKAKLLADRPISQRIYKHFEGHSCVACGSSKSVVIDHKNDLYNDPRVHNIKTQLVSDFQPLCNACNLKKRADCRKTKEQGKRQPAPFQLLQAGCPAFIEGDEVFDQNGLGMKGTYWYDVQTYYKHSRNK